MSFAARGALISADDLAHQIVPHHVAFVKRHMPTPSIADKQAIASLRPDFWPGAADRSGSDRR